MIALGGVTIEPRFIGLPAALVVVLVWCSWEWRDVFCARRR